MLLIEARRLPAPTGKQVTSEDSKIQTLAYQYLDRHSHFRGYRQGHLQTLSIEVRQGTLILEGRLPSFYLKQVLQTALRKVPGVQEIKNRVVVVSSDGLSSTPKETSS